jgi:beta-lactamase regulating signal transducer with metallopeptidase domain
MNPSVFASPDATLAFAAGVVLRVTVLLGAAGVLALALRRASAASRHLLWMVALGAVLALPLLVAGLPGWTVRVPAPSLPEREPPAATALAAALVAAPPAAASLATGTAASTPATALPSRSTALLRNADASILLALWIAGVLLAAGRLLLGRWGVRRLARRAEPVRDAEWNGLLRDLAWMLDIDRPTVLLRSAHAAMPMTWGMRRPRILLPAGADGWTPERRRVVLLHELAHVARGDCLSQTLADVACALFWFHPLAWYAAGRMRAERERACDDRVLAAGARASDYAAHLLEVARAFRPARLAGSAALAMARPSQLEGRLLAVLDSRRSRVEPGRGARAAAAGAALALALPLARPARPGADRRDPGRERWYPGGARLRR